jgi:hypothetical protein
VVEDQEVLFRRVKHEWVAYDQGQLRLSSQAFADKGLKPSVNRAALKPNPAHTQYEGSDGVAQLVTLEVRQVDTVMQNAQAPGQPQLPYRLDVLPRPILAGNEEGEPENLAHAQIESAPDLQTKSRFDKVKDALARLAERRPLAIDPTPPI